MTLLWFDGFESYANEDDADALTNIICVDGIFSTSYGRRSSYGMRLDFSDDFYICNVPGEPDTVILGFAIYIPVSTNPTLSATYAFLRFRDALATGSGFLDHVKITSNPARELLAYHGDNTLLGTSSGFTFNHSTWYYMEVKVKIHDTTGTVEIKVDGNQVLNLTGKDTLNGSNAYVGGIFLTRVREINGIWYDDLYVCDNSGSVNNDFLGDIRVDALKPNGAGTYTNFTPSTGSNYENVDETHPDDDTTYNETSSNTKDSYNLESMPSPPTTKTIHGFKSQITIRKTDAGIRAGKILTRSGTTDTLGSTIVISDTYRTNAEIYEENPDDSAAWEDADINAVQVGVEVIS